MQVKNLLKFGVQIPQEGLSYKDLLDLFKIAEELKFDVAMVYDHFHPIWSSYNAPNLESWSTIAALSRDVKKIKLGTLVTCNSYRYPSVLAKIVSTVDNISNGRVHFMIGAGWYKQEYLGYGIPFETPRKRILKLREAIMILKKMWTEEKSTFKGEYYSIKEAINFPKPVQKPYPRIWVGGAGERIMLKVIAEVADGWDVVGVKIEDYARKKSILEKYLDLYKRGSESILRSWSGQVIIGNSKIEVSEKVAKLKQKNVSFEEFASSRIVGIPSECIDRIEEYRKLGVSYVTAIFPNVKDKESMKLFSEKVIEYYKEMLGEI